MAKQKTTPHVLTQEEKKYLDAIERLAKQKSSFIFKNSSHLHASIVLSVMMNNCGEEFRIYDDDLSGDIADKYEGFYDALTNFVKSGKTLKIVVDDNGKKDNYICDVLQELHKQYPTRVFVRHASQDFFRFNQYGLRLPN